MNEIAKSVVEDDEAYLIMPEEHVKKIATPETIWAKIGEDGQLEVIRWDIIEMFALEYDSYVRAGKEKTQSHIICKLLVLVRDQIRNAQVSGKRDE